jgi:tRNA threonylcarbamoyladenosine biosynthesis protein TsaE
MGPQVKSQATYRTSPPLVFVTHSPVETQRLGARLAALLQPGDVVAMQGDLGSGKTQFVKGLARGLGVREAVHSPTFILANEYRSGRLPVFHVDAYRVESAGEAIAFGLEDYLNDAGVTTIEWADRVGGALPQELLWIEFADAGDDDRTISLQARGKRYVQLLEEFSGWDVTGH